MSEASVFDFGNLLIWVPGLIFVAAVLAILYLKNRGGAPTGLYWAALAFFLISLAPAVFVPMNQIGKAVEFANNYEPYEGPAIDGYEDIPYNVKDAWFQTALPPEERRDSAGGGDIFDFGGEESPADGDAADAEAATGQGADETLTYNPARSLAWVLLMIFVIPGIIFLAQDKLRLPGSSRAGA